MESYQVTWRVRVDRQKWEVIVVYFTRSLAPRRFFLCFPITFLAEKIRKLLGRHEQYIYIYVHMSASIPVTI